MNERPEISDDSIQAMLEGRAARGQTAGVLASVRLAGAATPQQRAGRIVFGLPRGPIAAGVAGFASLAILLLALGLATGWRLPGVATASGGPSGSQAPGNSSSTASIQASPPAAAGPVLPLTVDQLNVLLATNPKSLSQRQLVIDGTVEGNPVTISQVCLPPSGNGCTPTVFLAGSQPLLFVEPTGDRGPGPWDLNGAPLTGPFAAVLVNGNTLDYQGAVRTTGGSAAFRPSQLPDPSGPNVGVGYWLVQGSIAGSSVEPHCLRALATPYPGPQYNCGRTSWLSDDASAAASGVSLSPPVTIRVQNDAYQDFAPSPSASGPLVQPEQATFLVHAIYIPACAPTADCFFPPANYHWAIVTRLDPWPVAPVGPATSTSPPPLPEAQAPVLPLTVDQLNVLMATDASSLVGRTLVIKGTVERNQTAISCFGTVGPCAPVVLVGSNPVLGVVSHPNQRATPSGGAAWVPDGVRLTGPFAAVLADSHTLDYQGSVLTTDDGGTLLPSQLSNLAFGNASAEVLVHGWIAGTMDPMPCPTDPNVAPSGGPQYGCGRTTILSDDSFQPVSANSFLMPPNGIQVQNDAYQEFAPTPGSEPVAAGSTPRLSHPEQATFLVRLATPASPACSSQTNECQITTLRWEIISRLDPWPVTAAEPTPVPPTCASSALKVSFGGWGAAGGSTYTPLKLTLTDGQPCSLLASPSVTILDSRGQTVVSASSTEQAFLLLTGTLQAELRWSSWCKLPPSGPLTVRLDFGTVVVYGQLPEGFSASCQGVATSVGLDQLQAP
jgi:hypothetical protein